jgi:alpha-glucosidase
MAKRKGNRWYVGAITNWDKRTIQLDLSFLGEGQYEMRIIRDGINADKKATDHALQIQKIPTSRIIEIEMAPGGGWVAEIEKR